MHTKIKSLIILLLLSSLSLNGFTQNLNSELTQTIRGVIIDAASGYPLPDVSVGLIDLPTIGGTTDSLGHFNLKNVPVGRHTIQATFVGYETSIFREIMVTSAKEIYLEIPLKEKTQELGEVIVQARTNKNESINKMATTGARMLSVEEASRYAGGMDDPARLVSSFAGVAPAVSNNGISIHGNAPHLLQWRLEDIEIPNPNHFADIATLGGGILSSLSSHVLGNSDFFIGAFPAEYGNAVSGVFDMKLRNGNNQKHENTFQVGILGIDFASEGPINRNNNSSYIFNYRYSTTGLLKHMGSDLGGTFDYQDLNFKLNFPTRNAGTFSVWGTALIDGYENDIEDDINEWEYFSDRNRSKDKQYMVSGGLSHRYYFNDNTFLKSTLGATYYRFDATVDILDMNKNESPYGDLFNQTTNLIFNTSFNKKISSKFNTKTGFTFTKMFYEMNLKKAPFEKAPLETMSEGEGNTELISGYTSATVNVNDKVTMNLGVNGQFLTLNDRWTIEPRIGIKWQQTDKSSFALAYGLHSRMEKIDVFFVKTPGTKDKLVNKDLDFTKAHHIMFSYNYKISDDMNLRIEPYFQYLYDVPVIADSSYSVLNRDVFYVEDALVNKGRGRNYGLDITLEKYFSKGYYYMINGSVFDSRYRGGDGKWYNTKFNRNFIINALGGKEWMMGRNKQNVLSVNLKLTLQGGDRYAPVDVTSTMNHPDKDIQYDERKAYSKQISPMLLMNYSVSYRINKKKISHEFAIKVLNCSGYKEFYGHEYNIKTHEIDVRREETALSNISYRLDF